MRNEVSLLFISDANKMDAAWIIKSDWNIKGVSWYLILKSTILTGNGI